MSSSRWSCSKSSTRGKKGVSEVARNVRQVSRFLDELIAGQTHEDIERGLSLDQRAASAAARGNGREAPDATGRLFFETRPPEGELPTMLPGNKADNSILLSALALRKSSASRKSCWSPRTSICGSRHRWSASKPRTISTTRSSRISTCSTPGMPPLPVDFWEQHAADMESWQDMGQTYLQGQRRGRRRMACQRVAALRSRRTMSNSSPAISRATPPCSNWPTISAKANVMSGACMRAIASRTSLSTC